MKGRRRTTHQSWWQMQTTIGKNTFLFMRPTGDEDQHGQQNSYAQITFLKKKLGWPISKRKEKKHTPVMVVV